MKIRVDLYAGSAFTRIGRKSFCLWILWHSFYMFIHSKCSIIPFSNSKPSPCRFLNSTRIFCNPKPTFSQPHAEPISTYSFYYCFQETSYYRVAFWMFASSDLTATDAVLEYLLVNPRSFLSFACSPLCFLPFTLNLGYGWVLIFGGR